MRVLGLLAFLIIGLFVVLLGFLSIGDDKIQGGEPVGGSTESGVMSSANIAMPSYQDMDLQFQMQQQEQLFQSQMQETQLKYQHELEQQRLEYQSLLEQQRMLTEGQSQQSLLEHEKQMGQQEIQKELLIKQQDVLAEQQGREHEMGLTGRIIEYESKQQQQQFQHEQSLAVQNTSAKQQELSAYLGAAIGIIALLSATIYILFNKYSRTRVDLVRMTHEQTLLLEEHKALQETRMKVLDAIADFPDKEKKEIISGLVNGPRHEQLQHDKRDEMVLDIDLEDLNPPDMHVSRRKA